MRIALHVSSTFLSWVVLVGVAVPSLATIPRHSRSFCVSQQSVVVSHFFHDPLGRRTAAIRPSGTTDSFAYDGLGNWTTYTNAEGHVFTMTYDLSAPQSLATRQAGALSRPLAATNALGQQVFHNHYDPAGNLTNRLDGAGNATRYAYDELNQLVRQESGVRGLASSFSYDAVGNLLTACYGPNGQDWGTTGTNPTPFFAWLGGHGVVARPTAHFRQA